MHAFSKDAIKVHMAENKQKNSLLKRIRRALVIYLAYGIAFSVLFVMIGRAGSIGSFLYTTVLWLPVMVETFPYESRSLWIYIFLILFLFMEVQIILKDTK